MKKPFSSYSNRIWTILLAVFVVVFLLFGLVRIVWLNQWSDNTELLYKQHDELLDQGYISDKPFGNHGRLQHFIVIEKNGNFSIEELPKERLGVSRKSQGTGFQHWRKEVLAEIDQDIFVQHAFFYPVQTERGKGVVSNIANDGDEHTFLVSIQRTLDDGSHFLQWIIGIGLLIILFILTKFVANYLARPVKEMEEYSQQLTEKQWSEPLEVQRDDELGMLMNRLNDMQELLQQREQEQKNFLQSISHDLKTPIAVILGHAQGIIDGVYVESREANARIIQEEALRLNDKVKKILYYNTLDFQSNNQQHYSNIALDQLRSEERRVGKEC